MPGNKAVPWGHSVSLSGWWHIDRRQLLGVTAGDVSAVESAARAWQSEHYFYKQFSVAELAKCRTTLRCWMKLTPDRIWLGTHSYTLTLLKWFKVHFTPLMPVSAPRTTSRTDPRRRINSSCSELSTPASSWRWAVTARPLRCQVRVLHQTCHSQCVTSVPSMWVSV